MRYAISYVSTAKKEMSEKEVGEILTSSEEYNNEKNITGLLLFSDGNFFQVIEGEEEKVKDLFETIKHDERHTNVIKLFEKPIYKPAFDGYISDYVTENTKYNPAKLKDYHLHLEVLDSKTRHAVNNVLRAFIY
ncbi:BLUF domain-containing protein [Gramella jeungdoensis]|uniref:BLUF domain-containing protein n=1 Tax=Gramella jeungdoensis TaxID=708091 RepID=A0ABT0YZX8_9FLAO|nr:BLUF domain-containing protein [Gramella jeungdoensis]MCM8569030.1 BLUF domain-containing protein [Gramella jeungdoensis]